MWWVRASRRRWGRSRYRLLSARRRLLGEAHATSNPAKIFAQGRVVVIQLVKLFVEIIDPVIELNDVVSQPQENANDCSDCYDKLDILVHDIALSDANMP